MTLTQFWTLDAISNIYVPLCIKWPWLIIYFAAFFLVVSVAWTNMVTAIMVTVVKVKVTTIRTTIAIGTQDRGMVGMGITGMGMAEMGIGVTIIRISITTTIIRI